MKLRLGRKVKLIFGTFFVSLLSLVLMGELLMRLLTSSYINFDIDERNLLYQHDDTLGWLPVMNSCHNFLGSNEILVHNNSVGFRDIEHPKKSNKHRIAFLGDSFVWGYDVNAEDRFTELLRSELPDVEIVNLGVSGYGTDQEYLLLKKVFDNILPDEVVLIITPNDKSDNSSNMRYGGYYKPYFLLKNKELDLSGIPVPKSLNHYHSRFPNLTRSRLVQFVAKAISPKSIEVDEQTIELIQAIHTFLSINNSRLILAFTEETELAIYQTELDQLEIPFISVENEFVYPTHGNHWTPEGHRLVSQIIMNFIEHQHKN